MHDPIDVSMTETIYRDWRSKAYGANKRAHLFVWQPFHSQKEPACGVRNASDYRSRSTVGVVYCRECLAWGRRDD